MDALKLAAALIAVILGALMVAEGVLGWANGTSLLYEGVDPTFKFVVGFVFIVLATPLIPESKK